ncbi:hypothetical protein M2T70_04835 [Elizabethkingia anophelis]|uniref:hypothetical protein n=1 Tax=Elizabethkingia anophelis TaxID=1117645 RepID=UPI00160DFDAB|nr:hypothetical protein [Elizabethkingia anophelis]MCL1648270.1 hypothetical protein [Elizabethkingia anophelis]MCL1683664.1 hypothetical protein [Elizabethkingia anophelis]
MFVQLFINSYDYVLVNYNHIVLIEPDKGGSVVTLSNGTILNVQDEPGKILEQIANMT